MATKQLVVRRHIDIDAGAARVWEIIVSPAQWPKWMKVIPAVSPVHDTIELGSKIAWKDEHGQTYLAGTIIALDRKSRSFSNSKT